MGEQLGHGLCVCDGTGASAQTCATAEHSQTCLRCRIRVFDSTQTDLFHWEITQPANSQPAAFPSKSPTQNVASHRGIFLSSWCFISWENQHCNREQFVPLILSLLMPHPLYFHSSINALLSAHECRYFVSLLHSGDWDNFLFRMEKDINRIFNKMTVSTSYTWTKNCKWPCNVLYTCFFSQIALQAIYNSYSTYPCIWNVFLSHLLAD